MSITAIVEIPKDSTLKLEAKQDPITGLYELVLDRVLNQKIPFNYGFFPNTLVEDNDPLDTFFLHNNYLLPLQEVEVEIIGGFSCLDGGIQDDKLLVKLINDSNIYDVVKSNELIKKYLETYKKDFVVLKELTKDESIWIYEESKVN